MIDRESSLCDCIDALDGKEYTSCPSDQISKSWSQEAEID